MKKAFSVIMLALFLTGCSGENVQSEGSTTSDNVSPGGGTTDSETCVFSQEELDLIRLNAGQSNYSNSVNLKGNVPGKMCYVEETDTLFYSDKDGLFQKTGEKIVKLLDTPVSALNIAGGKLYFMISENEIADHELGKVYCMELSDGKTECIIDEDVSDISVYKDRIFCQTISDLTELEGGAISYAVSFFKFGLNGEERTRIIDFAFSFEGDMCVTREGNSINLTDLSDGTSEKLIDEPKGVRNLSLYGGSLYYIRTDYSTLEDVLVRINLSAKTAEVLSAEGYIEDYGFFGGRLCVYTLTTFYLEENGKLIKYDGTKNIYKSIFTCGSKIYGMSDERLYEIELIDDRGMKSVSETVIGGVGNET